MEKDGYTNNAYGAAIIMEQILGRNEIPMIWRSGR